MAVIRILVGAAVLFLGRQLFWLFVGAAGFVVGFGLAERFVREGSDLLVILIGLAAGVIGAVLAMFLQRLAVAAAGFVAGGYVLLQMFTVFGLPRGRLDWLIFVIGGTIGALLVSLLLDWALIVLSALTGANIIVRVTTLDRPLAVLVLVALVVFGIAVQVSIMQRSSENGHRGPTARSN